MPPYIKNVLQYCGYENCHTIATIQEDDLDYIESEVRKGGITTFFEGKSIEKILEGCTKLIDDFEISRGHKKLVIAAVKVVQEKLECNGADGFLEVSPKKKK